MDSLAKLLKNEDLLRLKNKIRAKFSYIDVDDFESAYNESVWICYEKFNVTSEIKFTTFFYTIFLRKCIKLTKGYKKYNILYDQHEQIISRFEESLVDLQDDERNLLIQRYLEQKTLKEISQDLGISDEVVRKRINKCLKKLREE